MAALPLAYRAVHPQSLRWESNPRGRHTKTAGFRYNTEAFVKSAQWESNPHVRHGKAIGYRYIMGAHEPVEAVGIEPTYTCLRGRLLTNVGHTSVQQVGEESNPAGRAVGFGNRVRSQTQSPPVFQRTHQYPVWESNPTSAA